ncbi:MAG: hypothetical protein HY722_04770 [Planctomycetes bacterium]|nr:hypothetical protein [Planctomycetota bacterium]
MAKDRIGVGWARSYDQGTKSYIAGSLDLGVLGDLPFAVFENERRDEARKQPTHRVVVTASKAETGDEKQRIYLGAGWSRKAREGDSTYIYLKLELNKLGAIGLPGVDFSGMTEPVVGRLVSVEPGGENQPEYVLYRAVADRENTEAVAVTETGTFEAE